MSQLVFPFPQMKLQLLLFFFSNRITQNNPFYSSFIQSHCYMCIDFFKNKKHRKVTQTASPHSFPDYNSHLFSGRSDAFYDCFFCLFVHGDLFSLLLLLSWSVLDLVIRNSLIASDGDVGYTEVCISSWSGPKEEASRLETYLPVADVQTEWAKEHHVGGWIGSCSAVILQQC